MKLSHIHGKSKFKRCRACGGGFEDNEDVWTTGGGGVNHKYYHLRHKPKEY